MSVDEVRASIIGEQAHVLQKVKGIGAKSAKQIILDLKSKLSKETPDGPVLLPSYVDNSVREEAISALLALGFNRIAVQKAINNVISTNPDVRKVEEIIRLALRALAT
jgi:Holliday junction DNA helicase RuvA